MLNNSENKSFFIIDYDKKYLKQIVELFINTVHNINKKDYTKEQLNAWANPKYDLNIWEKRFEKSKPYLCVLEDEVVGFCEYYAWFTKSKSKVQNSIDPTTRETINQSLG